MEKLGNFISAFIKGKTPKVLYSEKAEGLHPYVSPDYLRGRGNPEFFAAMTNKTIPLEDDEIIILWDGSNAGEVLLSKKGILASTMVKLLVDETKLDKKYFAYSCLNLEYILKAKTAGSGIPHADKGVIKNLPFYFPTDKAEQTAIAKILSTVDEAIRSTRETISKLERVKKSLMQNLLSGRMKPDGTLRTADEFYEDEKMGVVPRGWKSGRLSEIAEIIAGQSPQGEFYNDEGLGMPMLNGPTEFTKTCPIPVQWTTKVTKLCEKGDILFTVRGSSTGRMNFADQVYCIGRGLAAIRPKANNNLHYIYFTLVKISEMILAEAKGAGTTFPNVSRGDLLKKLVLIPDNQKEIVNPIETISKQIETKKAKITALELLKKSLMQQLLTGRVRVKC